jgi:hypothetical protein
MSYQSTYTTTVTHTFDAGDVIMLDTVRNTSFVCADFYQDTHFNVVAFRPASRMYVLQAVAPTRRVPFGEFLEPQDFVEASMCHAPAV